MDRPFEMADALAAQHLAVEVDENEVLVEGLLEADIAALQPQPAAPRVAVGEVAERHVVVALEIEDAMGPRDVEQGASHLVVLHHAGLVAEGVHAAVSVNAVHAQAASRPARRASKTL